MKRSHKKTALITGATGQLGWAVANFLHDQGWRLLLLARNGQAMQLAFGHLPDVVLLDVDLTQREALIARVQAALGREAHLDAVCHLAGGFHMGDGVDALSLPTWEYLLNLNTTSFEFGCRRGAYAQAARRWPCGHGRGGCSSPRAGPHGGLLRRQKRLAAADRGLVGRAENGRHQCQLRAAYRARYARQPRRHARCQTPPRGCNPRTWPR